MKKNEAKNEATSTTTNEVSTNQGRMKGVWSIVENDRMERPIWIRLGTAFVNRDNSLNVYLDAMPTNARLHIRDLEVKTAADEKAPA
jgi:hypothetical protein